MRRWNKYVITAPGLDNRGKTLSATIEEHASDLGLYESEQASPDSREAFFEQFYWEHRHFETYESFLRSHQPDNLRFLSIGSGTCAFELKLMESGRRVVCSDLGKMDSYPMTKGLFPELEHIDLDIRTAQSP